MNRSMLAAATISVAVVSSILPRFAFAQQPVVSTPTNATAAQQTSRYWTGVRMQAAQPRIPDLAPGHANPSASTARAVPSPSDATDGVKVDGALPTVPPDQRPPAVKKGVALTPDQMRADYGAAEVIPGATSQYGLPFTTSQVEPEATRLSYPYVTSGKLFFTEQGVGNFVCSASSLRVGIVVTAGHCVYQPQTAAQAAHFFTNFFYVPAYDNGNQPVGGWTPIQEGTTAEWASGGGTVPNAQDVGMLVMDQLNGQRIGEVTGYLGYFTGQLKGNNVTMLGYPCNLDRCEVMERTDAGNSVFGGSNTYIYGSAAAGGASGGPWIQDFGSNPVNTGGKAWPLGLNYLVSVTSYQPADGLGGYLGGSNLTASFLNLLALLCRLNASAC